MGDIVGEYGQNQELPPLRARQRSYLQLLERNPDLEALLKQLRGFEKELDVARMRMHPYL